MEENKLPQVSFTYWDNEFIFTGEPGEYIFERLRKFGEFYEVDLLESIGESIFAYEGDIVDVGANLGNHTVYFGSVLKRQVFAFEPEPLNFDFLRSNIRLNGLEDSVEAFNLAAWDTHELVSLHQKIEQNNGTFSVLKEAGNVEAAPLDDFLENKRVALVKIDVEGAELKVLNGLQSTIQKSRPIITVEAHSAKERSEQAAFFEERKYRCITIEGRSDNFVWCPEENLNVQRTASRLGVQKRRLLERGVIELRTRQELEMRRTTKIQEQIERILGAMGAKGQPNAVVVAADNNPQEQLVKILELIKAAEKGLEGAHEATHQRIHSPSQSEKGILGPQRSERDKITENAAEEDTLDQHYLELGEFSGSSLDGPLSALSDAHQSALDLLGNFAHNQFAQFKASVDLGESDVEDCAQLMHTSNSEAKVESALSRIIVDANQHHQTAVGMLRELQRRVRELDRRSRVVSTSGARRDEASVAELLRAEVSKLAFLLEKSNPDLWNSETLTDAVDRKVRRVEGIGLREESQNGLQPRSVMVPLCNGIQKGKQHGDKIRVGIASMPGREAGLRRVLEIMSVQADEVFVYLNNMTAVPESCRGFANVSFYTGPDLGDRGKFAFMEGFSGYYLTVDDDIEYAPFHVQHIIDGIERYGRSAVVGWHGSIFSENFEEFYNAEYRKVLSFRFLRGKDTQVHLLGTGVSGFHTDTIAVRIQDFVHPNMADVFLAIEAQRQHVPMMVLAHEKDWAKPIEVGPSISTVSMKKEADEVGTLDVAATVSSLVKEHMPWNMPKVQATYTRKPFTVAFIGRTDKERWKKGGILKSAHLTVTALARFGVHTVLEDIETGDPWNLSGKKADIVMVYVGDPERPDFKDVEAIVAHHADSGKKIVVNLSINGVKRRSLMVAEKMKEWEARWPNQMWLMVFTQAAFQIPELEPVKQRMLLIPKTIELPNRRIASFAESEGIFIGDIGKLNNDSLLDFPAEEWIAAIRESLPGVNIYAVKQYQPAHNRHLDIDKTWEFLRGDEFADKIGRRRLMVTPVKYATFEMVPVEVAGMGIPVVYPDMPQSLSEHLGGAGVVARTPKDLQQILPLLYNDPIVWKGMSQAGIEKAESSELGRASSQLYLQLAKLVQSN